MKSQLAISLLSLAFAVSCNGQNSGKEDFRTFLGKFSTDRNFQFERIIFPLEAVGLNENLTETITISVSKESWEHKNIFYSQSCNEVFPQVFDNFEGKLNDTGKRMLAWRGIENGFAQFYYFELKSGKWFLVKVENLST